MNALVHIDQGIHKVKFKNATNEKKLHGFSYTHKIWQILKNFSRVF